MSTDQLAALVFGITLLVFVATTLVSAAVLLCRKPDYGYIWSDSVARAACVAGMVLFAGAGIAFIHCAFTGG